MTYRVNRRRFLGATLGAAAVTEVRASFGAAPAAGMKMCLDPGSIGVKADQFEAIDLAAKYGFEAVQANVSQLISMSDEQRNRAVGLLQQKGLVWGSAGLPVQFREGDDRFKEDLEKLRTSAGILEQVGVKRVGTWILPSHETLTYMANFERHARRLREVAQELRLHGMRLGLEYVGPKTSWTAARFPFIHTMAETKELIAAIGQPNVGFVLDSWHWYTSGETREDILSLTSQDVVSVDLNDAPAGIPVDQQMDLKRKLPMATGVIDVGVFLDALKRIGFDGPVRAEPFDQALNSLPPEEAVAKTAAAMKKAFALVRG